MIDFVNDFNNREMIYHEKAILQESVKLNIICNHLHKRVLNNGRYVIDTAAEGVLEAMLR